MAATRNSDSASCNPNKKGRSGWSGPIYIRMENRLLRVFVRHRFGSRVGCIVSRISGICSGLFSRIHGFVSGFCCSISCIGSCSSSLVRSFCRGISSIRSRFFDDRGFFNNRRVVSRSVRRCTGCESQGGSAQSDDVLHNLTPVNGLSTGRRHSIRQAKRIVQFRKGLGITVKPLNQTNLSQPP